MTFSPTGRRETRQGRDSVVFDRTFAAPAASVWAAITESDRFERWIGTWTGDPSEGTVVFRMTAEGDDVPDELFTIHRCEPPHLLAVSSQTAGDEEPFDGLLGLTEEAGTTVLTFSHAVYSAACARASWCRRAYSREFD
jgi:uncharacterized protein YndB with AHSA1/START domain